MLLGTVEEGVDEGLVLGDEDDGFVELGTLLLGSEVLGIELLGALDGFVELGALLIGTEVLGFELLGALVVLDSRSLSEVFH